MKVQRLSRKRVGCKRLTLEAENTNYCEDIVSSLWKHKAAKAYIKVAFYIEDYVGVGLIDYLIKAQDTDDGEYLPPFGVYNTDEYPDYKKFVTP